MNRRVQDQRNYDLGTAVAEIRRGQYRVQWDNPTPYQDEAAVPIPSADFIWMDINHVEFRVNAQRAAAAALRAIEQSVGKSK